MSRRWRISEPSELENSIKELPLVSRNFLLVKLKMGNLDFFHLNQVPGKFNSLIGPRIYIKSRREGGEWRESREERDRSLNI